MAVYHPEAAAAVFADSDLQADQDFVASAADSGRSRWSRRTLGWG